MKIPDGYHPLPPGKVAAVVTYLDMREKPVSVQDPLSMPPLPILPLSVPGLDVVRVRTPDASWYRALFQMVGQDWLWFSRLSMSDEALVAIIHDPLVEVYVLRRGMAEIGLLELDFRHGSECEIAYLGLATDAIGTGAGPFLMQFAIRRAWSKSPEINRLHVHTCTLDHPRAVSFYQRSGFKAYARAIEIADDPRLDGRLPRNAAGWLPLL